MATIDIEIDPNLDSQKWRQDIEGTTYIFKFIFNAREGQYQMELYDADEDLIGSTPLVFGQSLLAEVSDDRKPPGFFNCFDTSGEGGPADQDTIGRNVKLYYTESTDYESIV